MPLPDPIQCDLLIIGAGISGMAAAARASAAGVKTVLAGNSGALMLNSGLFDCLGVSPGQPGKVLPHPVSGLADLAARLPGHPYVKAGRAAEKGSADLLELCRKRITAAFNFFHDFLSDAGLAYHLSGAENLMVPTAMGNFKPSFMIPETMTKGTRLVREPAPLLLIDFRGLQGYSAKQAAGGLAQVLPHVRTLRVEIPGIGKTVPPQVLAGLMAEPRVREALIKQVMPFADRVEMAGMPAVCGIHNSMEILGELETATGLSWFEIPAMPPSIPGLRLKNACEGALEDVRFLSNVIMCEPVFNGRRFVLRGKMDSRDVTVDAGGVILATGRFFSGGLLAKRERIVEPVFFLDVLQPVNRTQWHEVEFLARSGHDINRAGIETDDRFRPLDARGRPVFRNLYAVGSILAHNEWTRLKSGAGVSLVSACAAVDDFIRRQRV